MKQPEAAFKTALVEAFRERFPQGWSVPLAGGSFYQPAGLPDRLFGVEGTHAFVEAKADAGRLRSSQELMLPRLARSGLRTFLVTVHGMKNPAPGRNIAVEPYLPSGVLGSLTQFPWAAMKSPFFWNFLLKETHL